MRRDRQIIRLARAAGLIAAVSLLLSAAGSLSAQREESLAAHYSFDEIFWSTVPNESGTWNDGILGEGVSAPSLAEGLKGSCLKFDGADDYVRIPTNDASNLGAEDPFTIMFWIHYEMPAGAYWYGVIQKWEKQGESLRFPFRVEINSSHGFFFDLYDGTASPKAELGDWPDGWRHVAFVRDSAAKKLLGYLDGEPMVETSDATTGETANSGDIYLGSRQGNGVFFKGRLDELRIWDAALGGDEIRSIYESYFASPTPSPTTTPAAPSPTPTTAPAGDEPQETSETPTPLPAATPEANNAPEPVEASDVLAISLNRDIVSAGDELVISVISEPFSGLHDFYLCLLTPGSRFLSLLLKPDDKTEFVKGLAPALKNIPGIAQKTRLNLFAGPVPPGVPGGNYQIIAALFPSGGSLGREDSFFINKKIVTVETLGEL